MRPSGHSLAVVDRVYGRYRIMSARAGINVDGRLWNGPIAFPFAVNDWIGTSDSRVEEWLSD